jgi:hypothetical protein
LLDLFVNNEKTLLRIYEILFPRKTSATALKTNSLKQVNTLKQSSDTIRLGQKSDFLKGDSILQRSVDDTQAGTDLLQNSTMLPSILPAMNSIQSNDIMHSLGAGKSSQIAANQSPNSGMDPVFGSAVKGIHQPHHQKNLSFNIGQLNQRSVNQFTESRFNNKN